MKNQNEEILKILNEFDELNFKISKEFGNINLLSISIVELSKYIASALLNSGDTINQKTKFPFCNDNYLAKDIKYYSDKKFYNNRINLFKEKILSSSSFFSNSSFRVHSMIFSNFLKELDKKKLFTKKTYFTKAYLDNLSHQSTLIYKFLEKFKSKQKIKNNYFSENFLEYINSFFSKKKPLLDNSKFLFIGTNSNIENRIMSANYLLNNRKVISFNHANYSTLIYGEPLQEIGEYSFCNYYVDCGNLKFKKKYFKSDYFHPKILSCNFQKNFNFDEKKRWKNILFDRQFSWCI